VADITVFRGNTQRLLLKAKDSNGNAVDLTGYRVIFSIKPSIAGLDPLDATAIIKGEFTIDQPTSIPQGYYDLTVPDTDNGCRSYLFDMKYFSGTQQVNSSSVKFEILNPVTNREADDV
jgi:hypothetical protein